MSRLIPGPREGWLSLLLLATVVLTPALSLTEARWVDDLWVVPWLAFFSVLLGTVLAKLPVRGLVSHLFAAQIGLVLVATFFAAKPPWGDWEERFLWLGGRIWAWLEVALGGGMSNDDMLFALLMALLAWLLGYISGWFAFRKHSVWPSLIGCGSGLLLNLSYGAPSPLTYFLPFLLASMLLLTRVTLVQKERDWDRVDAEYNRRLSWDFLRGGAALSVGILAFAWSMPIGSVNAQVAENWHRVTGPWQGLQVEFDRLFASVGSSGTRAEGNRFAKILALKGAIELGPEPVMLVSSPRPDYWATQAYDRYTGQGWMSSASETVRLDPNDQRLEETSLYRGRQDVEQRFRVLVGRSTSVFAASSPVKLSLPVYADHFGTLEELAALRSTVPLRQGQQYAVISSVSTASVAQLRKAGTDYPLWIGRYLELPSAGSIRRVVAQARRVARNAENPYDAARALEEYLRGEFRYDTEVSPPPPDRDGVDWFLFTSREGYCDYFASAMAVMARALGIPSRVVSGYNTGTFVEESGLYEVRQENAHSWPELFFQDYGWVRFEPTPSQPVPSRPELAPEDETRIGGLAEGDLEAFSLDPTDRDRLLLDDELDLRGAAPVSDDTLQKTVERYLLLVPFVLLVGAMGAWVGWRVMLSRLSASSRAYLQMCLAASLLGWKPKPSYTPVEYGRVLYQASPELRSEVETVVGSYVEEIYGWRRLAGGGAAERSWRRMRLRLPLRLLLAALSRRESGAGVQLPASDRALKAGR